uniref:Acyltransferase n=1 Tax=Alexandrium monilatum TaxID=311494 RepID=A0A7S4PUE8_9DINO|mmetsp:Transcript_102271/g.305366  ORF Transcript_102271/g.305366 Transcript_102271/m.305366 type:complete len:366 (+) Transcript_102271:46-1143(+)
MGLVGALPKPSPPPAPPGSVEVRFERLTGFPGNVLQVLAELCFTSYFFFGPLGSLVWLSLSPWVFNLCSWRALWSFTALYYLQLFLYRPHTGRGWPYKWFLYGPLGDYVLSYHDATCIREGPAPDPNGKYVFAMYPHGVYGVCRAFSAGIRNWRTLYPGIFGRWGSFGAAFLLPGIREFSLFCGCLDASKPVLERAIRRGENIKLLPGGIDEMNLTDGKSKDTKLVMLDRKGFVKLAIENGMDVVPGYCFGEKYIHETVRLPAFVRGLLRPLRLSGTLLRGRGPTFMGFLQPPLGYVWGEPIKVKQQKPVEEKYLDEVHAEVMRSVQSIFDRHKSRFGYSEEETLTMVSVAEAKAAASGRQKKAA